MKRYLPILFALITLVVVNISIYQKQQLITHGKTMFVRLAPVDPRSLLQGDYMILRYELAIVSMPNSEELNKLALSLRDYPLTVTLDGHARVVASSFDTPNELAANQHRLIVKKSDPKSNPLWRNDLYPASNTFLFAEGLAWCYDNAVYAELKVAKSGQPLLYRLTDENLEPLNCEQKQRLQNERLRS